MIRILRFYMLLLGVLIGSTLYLSAAQPASEKQPAHPEAAMANLQKMDKAGIRNADLYNQLGLGYYQQGRTGMAVIFFLRALRLNSNHHDSRNNLNYVISQTLDKEMYTQPSFLASFFQRAFDFFSLNALAWITLCLLLVTVLCIHWLWHLPAERDKAVPVLWLVITGIVFLVFVTMMGLKFRSYNDDSKAVVMEPLVEGYSGPGPEFGKLFNVHEGLIITINRVDKDWALVSLPNGGAGWIQISGLERVNP